VTFLVTADTHLGWGQVEASTADADHRPAPIEVVHRRQMDDMLGLAGIPYPSEIGGAVAEPRGLLIAGDLTEHGTPEDWRRFLDFYGPGGRDNRLGFPVFAGIGNHDQTAQAYVAHQLGLQHGREFYSWNWQTLHLVCLSIAPDKRVLDWLEQDLAWTGFERPIVLYLHYPLAGPYSDTWFSREGFRDRLRNLLAEYNVVAIFHGHFHASGSYRWQNTDVYLVGSPKDPWRTFAVVRATEKEFAVSIWNYDLHAWTWWHRKPMVPALGFPLYGRNVPPGFEYAPLVQEPRD
jgi:3',5'-cyclic AMP phosphodiesterase CpdA